MSVSMRIQNLVEFYHFVLKILRGNENLTSIKGHNSVTMHIQNFVKFYQFALKILSGNEILNGILTSIKGHNSVTIVQKMMRNKPDLDLVKINAYTKFGKILLNYSQDIERKNNIMTDGMTDIMRDNPNPIFKVGL